MGAEASGLGESMGTTVDPFLSLRTLASYSCVSVRKLREFLHHPLYPLPSYVTIASAARSLFAGRSSIDGCNSFGVEVTPTWNGS